MSKELEALLDLFNAANRFNNEPYKFNTLELFERKQIIEQALKRLEAIDNAEPSEALECLEALEQDIKDRVILAEDRQLKLCAVIKQSLLKAQEQEAKFLDNLQRWFLLLGESGANTKYKVRDEMEAVIDELKEVLE